MSIQFNPMPDVTGLGRVVIDGRHYGLPADFVQMLVTMVTLWGPLERVPEFGRGA